MLVKEKLNGIFKEIENTIQYSDDRRDIFNFVNSDDIDMYFINSYGKRLLSDLANDLEIKDIAKVINNKYVYKWNNIILNYLDSNNLLDNYKEVISEVNTNNNTMEINRVNNNLVSAYNDDEYVESDKQVTDENNVGTNNSTKDIIRNKLKTVKYYENINNYLTNLDIYNIMIIDVLDVCTLKIFN